MKPLLKSAIALTIIIGLAAVAAWAANELQVQLVINYSKSGVVITRNTGNVGVTITNTALQSAVVTVSTNATALLLPAATGYVFANNTASSAWVDLSADGTNNLIRIPAGKFAFWPLSGNSLVAIAQTNTLELEYIAFPQ